MTRHRGPGDERDTGAALVIVIGFMLAIGAISVSLMSAIGSSMQNRVTLETVRNHEYAADAAVERAITQARQSSCDSPSGSFVDATVNATAIRVEWQATCGSVISSDGSPYEQRNVGFVACVDTGLACAAPDVIIRAQVNFEPARGPVTRTVVQSWSVNR